MTAEISLAEHRLIIQRELRALLISNHMMKLQELDHDIENLEVLIALEAEQKESLNGGHHANQ